MKVRLSFNRRTEYALWLVAVSGVGILSRVFLTGYPLIDKYLGDAVYAVFFYLCLGILWVKWTPARKAVLTLVFVLAVEVFQLTLIPLQFSLSDSFFLRFASVLLGTRFAWWDMLAYLVGIVAVYLADRFYFARPYPQI